MTDTLGRMHATEKRKMALSITPERKNEYNGKNWEALAKKRVKRPLCEEISETI